jgi:flagellar motor switch protein FliM
MSGEVLSADAIAALVDAAREGRLPEEPKPAARRRRMRPVDFTRPSKFSAEQERRLKRAIEAFCRTASTRLSGELRVPLELEMIDTNQLTWRDAHAQVPEGSVSVVAATHPIDTKLILASEMPVVLGAIELLLGGSSAADVTPRRLTDIDWALARHFFDRLLAQLSVVWQDMADIELSLENLEPHLETAQLVPVSEPTLSLMIEARLEGRSSMMALLLPWSSIAPVAGHFSGREDSTTESGVEDTRKVRQAVGRVEMTVRAEVASREMRIEDVLALQPGDVLSLNAPAEAGITIFADKVPVHRAKPGRVGSRRGAQVIGRVGDER